MLVLVLVFMSSGRVKKWFKDPDHRGFSGIFDPIGLSKTAQNHWKMTPKPPIYIYTYGDCTELFLYIKKNAKIYKDCRGFWVKKKRTFGGKNQLFDNFSMGLPSIPLMTVIWTLKPSVWAKIDQKWSKNHQKSIKKPLFEVIFQFSWVPPLENAKNRFSNMKSPLKMAKTSRSFDGFGVFFHFLTKNHQKTIFWPKNHQKTIKMP